MTWRGRACAGIGPSWKNRIYSIIILRQFRPHPFEEPAMAKSSSRSRKRAKTAPASAATVSSGAERAQNTRDAKTAKPGKGSKGTAAAAKRDKASKKAATDAKTGKVVRDSFTMPAAEYKLIRVLKERCLGLGMAIKKSELLRAGLALLQRLPKERLSQAVAQVDSVKTGRPPKSKQKVKEKRA
jgi:hypothetical protein